MRMIGIVGGMSAESTAHYYAEINAGVRKALGGLHSAEILLWSVDFAAIAAMQANGDWERAGKVLADIAVRLEKAGAEAIVLATNTMHKLAPQIEAAVSVPFIHIADATAAAIHEGGYKRPGLMATAYTMDEEFYVGRLRDRHGLDVVLPSAADRAFIHRVIYDELCKGTVSAISRAAFVAISERMAAAGADCLILGCTEVGMLLNAANVAIPVFDTTLIHAAAAVQFAVDQAHQQAAE